MDYSAHVFLKRKCMRLLETKTPGSENISGFSTFCGLGPYPGYGLGVFGTRGRLSVMNLFIY